MRHRRTSSWCLVLAMFGALLLTGCALTGCATTRPLVLSPRIKPLDFVVQQPYGPLTLIPFEDKTPEAEKGRKQFRERPIDVFNDTLLTAIRASQSFKSVVRGTDTRTAEFQLSGVVNSLATDESVFQFGLIPSTMKVSAVCVSTVRLVDVMTGTVLLEESVTTTGEGSARVTGGGRYAQYDSTYGYEESISQAISENVVAISRRLHEVLSKRR